MDDNLNKFDRIIAILIQLQSKPIVRAKDLAEKFHVSLRTIYRDIRTLESSGIPIIGESGSGYYLMEGYRLPPVMLTREEAGGLVTAEKLMQQFTDKSIGSFHESAMNKIKSVLRISEKNWMSVLENNILIHPAQQLFNENIPDAFEIVLESIVEKNKVLLEYQSVSEEITERIIEPVGIFHEFNFWYILGYCLLRQDYRQFRTDRIVNIRRTPEKFTKNHGKLEDYRKKIDLKSQIKVRIFIDKQIVRYTLNSRKNYGFISEKETEDGVEMLFMTCDIEESFPRWYLMFADYADIIEPEELRINVQRIIGQIQNRIKQEKQKN